MDSREVQAHQLAGRQDGLVTASELEELGFSYSAIRHRVESGRWRRVAQGVFALAPTVEGLETWLRAACLTLPGAIVSHEAAAELLEIPGVPRGRPVVSVPASATHRFSVVRVHRSSDIRSSHVQTRDGFEVTTTARTLFDLSSVLAQEELERVVDRAVGERLANLADVRRVLEQTARRGKPGVAALREILDERDGEPEMGLSALERRFLQLLIEADLPRPEQQVTLPWLSEWERADFAYISRKLVLELDGRKWHATADAWERDRERDRRAVAAGWMVVRFTWRQVVDHPSDVVDTIASLLDRSAYVAS